MARAIAATAIAALALRGAQGLGHLRLQDLLHNGLDQMTQPVAVLQKQILGEARTGVISVLVMAGAPSGLAASNTASLP